MEQCNVHNHAQLANGKLVSSEILFSKINEEKIYYLSSISNDSLDIFCVIPSLHFL